MKLAEVQAEVMSLPTPEQIAGMTLEQAVAVALRAGFLATEAAEHRIRAMRGIGQLLADNPHRALVLGLNIMDPRFGRRCETVAALPEPLFLVLAALAKTTGEELTEEVVVRMVRQERERKRRDGETEAD